MSPSVFVTVVLDRFCYAAFYFGDSFLVALVECPLLDALSSNEARLTQRAKMLARSRLRDTQLIGDEESADPVFDQIAFDLRWEMGAWIFEPMKDLQSFGACQCAKGCLDFHGVRRSCIFSDCCCLASGLLS